MIEETPQPTEQAHEPDRRPSLERAVIDLSKVRPRSLNFTALESRLALLRDLSPPNCPKFAETERVAQENVQRLIEQEENKKQNAEKALQDRIKAREEALKETEKSVLEIIDDIDHCLQQNLAFDVLYEDTECFDAFISFRDELNAYRHKTQLSCYETLVQKLGQANAMISHIQLIRAIKRTVYSPRLTLKTLPFIQKRLAQLEHQNKTHNEYVNSFIATTTRKIQPIIEQHIEQREIESAATTPLPSPRNPGLTEEQVNHLKILSDEAKERTGLAAAQAELDAFKQEDFPEQDAAALAKEIHRQEQVARLNAEKRRREQEEQKERELQAAIRVEVQKQKKQYKTASTIALSVGSVFTVSAITAGSTWLAATFSAASSSLIDTLSHAFPSLAIHPNVTIVVTVTVLIVGVALLATGFGMHRCSKQRLFSSEKPSNLHKALQDQRVKA